MPIQPPPRPSSVLASVLAAGLMLTVAGCSDVLPLGPAPAAPRHLATAIVLQAVRSQPSSPAGTCPAGSASLAEGAKFPGSGQCYRQLGKPLTITSAAVTLYQQPAGPQGQPAMYVLRVTLPAADRAALKAITTTAYHSRDQLATIVAGKTWGIGYVWAPFTAGQFEIPAQSRNQALQLERMLVPSG